MRAVEEYCKRALEMGIDGAKVINPGSIVTAEWVRMKCQFGCHNFGRSQCCPPRTPTPDQTRKVIDAYERAILLYRRLKKDERTQSLNATVVRLEIEIFLEGYYKVWSMGSGPCRLCKECDLTGGCRHGSEARPSMESCGVDVFKTARDNGFPIEVRRTREEERTVFGLILVE